MKKILLILSITFMFNLLFSDTIFYKNTDNIQDVNYIGFHNKKIVFSFDFDTSNNLYFVGSRFVAYITDEESNKIDHLSSIYDILNKENSDYENIVNMDFKSYSRNIKRIEHMRKNPSDDITNSTNNIDIEIDNMINDFHIGFGDTWTDEAKTTFYLAERLSPETALYYQFGSILPFTNIGYAYSDNWVQGAKWDGIMLGTVIFSEMIKGDCDDPDNHWDCENGYDEWENQSAYDILHLAALGIYIYKFVNAYNLAEEYNDNLYNRLFNSSRPYFSLETTADKSTRFALNIPIGK